MKIGSTLIIGAGGIGSHLAEPLARLLVAHPSGRADIKIVDGDKFEAKNAARQMFSLRNVGLSKSTVMAGQLIDALGCPQGGTNSFVSESGYVASPEDAATLMLGRSRRCEDDEALLVCLCVDNDATRRIFYDAIEMLPTDHRTILMVDCGNDLETSTVVASVWSNRKPVVANPVDCYENLKNPKDRVPGGGCLDLAPSTPQLMIANMSAAFGALLLVQAWLDDKGWTDVVQSNVRKFSVAIAGGIYGRM